MKGTASVFLRDALAARPFPYCHPDKICSVIFFSFPQLVAGGARWADQLLLRASTEHILIVRGLRARKLAARLAFTPHDEIFSVTFSFSHLVAGWTGVTSSARVERGPSQAARSASTEVPPPSRPSHVPASGDFSSSLSRRASPLFEPIISRSCTNALMMAMLT